MHPIQTAITELQAALKDAADANPVFLATAEKAEAILQLEKIKAGVEELELRVLAVAQDVAEQIGARDAGTWLVGHEIIDGPAARKELRLAQRLTDRDLVRTCLAEGRFSAAHAAIITTTLDDLDLGPEIAAKAEAHLCNLATQHRPADLRRLCRHLHEVIDPETAQVEEAKALARLEAAADAKTTLSITPLGDGTSKIHAHVPEAVGERLRTLIEAFAQPRIAALEADGRVRPRNRILAEAFGQLLECVDPERLPAHGGDSTTIIVTIPLAQLQSQLGVATMTAGTTITAAQAHMRATRPAHPALVASRRSRRARRWGRRSLPNDAPATKEPPRGGRPSDEAPTVAPGTITTRTRSEHHHKRAHDPTYQTTRLTNGDYRYHRRT